MSRKKLDSPSGEWEFNIDVEGIRAETAREEQQNTEEAGKLLAQLDEMSAPETSEDQPAGEPEKAAEPPAEPDAAEAETPAGTEKTAPPARPPQPQTRAASSAGTPRPSGRPPVIPPAPPASSYAQPPEPPRQPLTRREQRAKDKRDKRLAKVERRRQKNHIRWSTVLAPLLAITNIITLGFWGVNTLETRLTVQEAENAASEAEAKAAELQDELDNNTISLEDFTYYVAEYNLSAEFIQKFFDDRIVYKDTSVHYAEIDQSLPMNSYDWSALSWESGRPSYTPEGQRHAVLGVDVSYHQGDIDWDAVAADGVSFAMIRAGYWGFGTGPLMTDDYFTANMDGATAAGLDVGVYFFSQALSTDEAVEEAQYVVNLLSGYSVTMPVVFDMEVMTEDARANDLTASERAEIAKAFCDTIAAAGYTPMIYGNTAYYMAKIDFAEICGSYGIWLAQYYDTPFFPYEFTMWQYTNAGTVDGISGQVDLNLYFGE